MRTTVVPAQITTVEDKIIGNLSFMQVGILMIPIFLGVIVFILFPPTMHIVLYKVPPVLFVLVLCLILSLRVKGKVVASWFLMLFTYNTRPKYYVFNKNESHLRDIPGIEKEEQKEVAKVVTKKEIKIKAQTFGLKELKQWEAYIKNPNYTFSLKPGKKGALYVAIAEIEK